MILSHTLNLLKTSLVCCCFQNSSHILHLDPQGPAQSGPTAPVASFLPRCPLTVCTPATLVLFPSLPKHCYHCLGVFAQAIPMTWNALPSSSETFAHLIFTHNSCLGSNDTSAGKPSLIFLLCSHCPVHALRATNTVYSASVCAILGYFSILPRC